MLRKCGIILFTLAIAVFMQIAAIGQSKKENKISSVVNEGTRVSWNINVEYSNLILTVSAPNGEVYRFEYPSNSTPAFDLIDRRGNRLQSGSYSYELRLIPVFAPGVKEALANARSNGNEEVTVTDLKKRGLLPEPIIQSGSFSITGTGVVVGGEMQEPQTGTNTRIPENNVTNPPNRRPGGITLEDVVNPDDFIVQGSLCVGLDCVNNENFGFDTIRLKENNTRIKFEDTSTSPGFPSNDWQLTANDSANGGQNKFSIEDIDGAKVPFTIIAGAPTNSMVINSAGRLGLRTATPVLDIHTITGDTPAIRLEQDGSGGFTPQTWDIAGNEANFFIRDVTNGSRLPFRIRPGAPTNSIDIDANGVVSFQNGFRFFDSSSNSFTTVIAAPTNGDKGGALQIMGSTGTPDEDSSTIVEMNANTVGVKSGSTGTVTMRYNVPVTANFIALNASIIVFKTRFRDSDGAGNNARVRVIIHTTNIDTGADTAFTFFDSNTQAATGASFATSTLCVPAGSNVSFATSGIWLEVIITKSTLAEQADFGQVQMYRTAGACPP